MNRDRPIRILTEKELKDIAYAFGYGSVTPYTWASKRLYEFQSFIESGGILEIPFEFGRLPPQRLVSLATYMNWQNEVWGRYDNWS